MLLFALVGSSRLWTPLSRLQSSSSEVEEALRDAEKYSGPEPLDPTEIHPNKLPLNVEWTCEDFHVKGYAEWTEPTETTISIGFDFDDDRARSVRRAKHMDHLYWARSSEAFASYSLVDVAGSVVCSENLDDEPFFVAGVYDRTLYDWKISQDPYLRYDAWQDGDFPFLILRFFEKVEEIHFSFMRKTKRIHRTGLLYDKNSGKLVGELTLAFHPSREFCQKWLSRDPLQTDSPPIVTRYNSLDVSGDHNTQPYPLNLMADPLRARLVDDGLVDLEERQLTRVEFDAETGKYTAVEVTTNDPRYRTNVVSSPIFAEDLPPSDD